MPLMGLSGIDDGHAIVHHAHDEGTHDRTDDLADTTGGRCAADETRCDDVELESGPSLRRFAIQTCGENQTGQRCERSGTAAQCIYAVVGRFSSARPRPPL